MEDLIFLIVDDVKFDKWFKKQDGIIVIVHPSQYEKVRLWATDVYDEKLQRDLIMSGLYSKLGTIEIKMNDMAPEDSIRIIGEEWAEPIPLYLIMNKIQEKHQICPEEKFV